MYLQMKLRHYNCADCGTPCKTTSPNAVRCPKCGEGVGEGAEPAESATEISAVDGGTAGRLTVNLAVGSRSRIRE